LREGVEREKRSLYEKEREAMNQPLANVRERKKKKKGGCCSGILPSFPGRGRGGKEKEERGGKENESRTFLHFNPAFFGGEELAKEKGDRPREKRRIKRQFRSRILPLLGLSRAYRGKKRGKKTQRGGKEEESIGCDRDFALIVPELRRGKTSEGGEEEERGRSTLTSSFYWRGDLRKRAQNTS